jgi:ATP-binding protein involved in chromosome partitioning
MSPTNEELLEVLNAVLDPELDRPVTELGMIKGLALHGESVQVAIALPADSYPSVDILTRRVGDALGFLEGVESVDVELALMSAQEQADLATQLLGDLGEPDGEHAGHGHAEGRPVMFAQPGNRTRVLLIASGKGGVGKSTVTTNLAISLAQRGRSVGLVDADVWGFSIPRMLGVEQAPMAVDKMVVPPKSHGVRCISMGFFAAEDQPVIWRGPMLHKALEQFLADVYWNDPDYLLVDLPPGTGDVSLSLAQYLPKAEVLVVTTPQPAAQTVAQRAAFMAEKVNLTTTGVIENMSWFIGDDGKRYELFGSGGGQALAELVDVPLIAQIPLVTELREGSDTGNPITVESPDSEPAKVFAEMARIIDEDLKPTLRYNSELRLT